MSLTYPKIILTTPTETVTFSGSAVIDASLLEETNPVSVEVPYNVLTFKVINTNVDFSMFSGSLLSERLPLMLYENIDGVDTFIGKFYLETFKNETEYEVSFTAIDIIGALASTDYDGGFWATPTTLENVLSDILSPLGILYTLDDSIKDTLIQGYNPSGNYRDALQQVCFAAMATASSARSDRLVISPKSLPVGPYTKKIHNCEKLTSQPIELLPIVTKIELISHDYTQSTAQITDIFSQYLEAGSHKIVFDQPYYNIVIDGPGYTPSLLITENDDFIVTENDDYIEVGGQYTIDSKAIYLEMQEAGTVTVTGYAYTDNKKSHIFNETGITNYSNKKTLQI